jgi:hypothetical protein
MLIEMEEAAALFPALLGLVTVMMIVISECLNDFLQFCFMLYCL